MLLSEAEFDRISNTVPSSRDRWHLLTHNIVLQHRLKEAERSSSSAEVELIIRWLEEHHTADTVRAQYARKLAARIRNREYLGETEPAELSAK
jgi:hypothetical protein